MQHCGVCEHHRSASDQFNYEIVRTTHWVFAIILHQLLCLVGYYLIHVATWQDLLTSNPMKQHLGGKQFKLVVGLYENLPSATGFMPLLLEKELIICICI